MRGVDFLSWRWGFALHVLKVSVRLPVGITEVFGFFSDASNLERITPPELRFRITSPQPILIGRGTTIRYRLRLFGLPFHWLTEITRWEPPRLFVDEQVQGPYRTWIHTHAFRENHGGTTMTDDVRYRLPLWLFGELAYPLVRFQLNRIFGYRNRVIRLILSASASLGREKCYQ
jgi:ligand-binding SRPBCC domain-containing protein